MKVDFATLSAQDAYRWLASTVTPRPIAWVSTRSAQGVDNLAPFSFFQVVSDEPPTLLVTINLRDDGSAKDTLNNVQASGELVIQLVNAEQAQWMNQTAEVLPAEVSEFAHCTVPSVPAEQVKALRVRGAPVAFECRAAQILPYPSENPSGYLVFAQVLLAHIDDQVLTEQGRVDPARLDLVGRLGGSDYCTTQERFQMQRP